MIAAFAAAVCLVSQSVVPVAGHVTDWFRRPDCGWCAGNRGLEFATEPGAPVHAPVGGTVSFAGPVGGVRYVVIKTAELKTDVAGADEPLFAVLGGVEPDPAAAIARGTEVGAGTPIGRATGWLFVGFRLGPRRDNRYLDPAPLLGIGRKSARLVAPDRLPVSLSRRPGSRTEPRNPYHCSALPPVVASARESGP